VEDEKQVEQDKQRADVFDALGHPTRILILKVLSEGSLGFADLKKKTGFESSGHLQHHLSKLNGLIRTDEYGKYCLSDEGKDALLTVKTVENASVSKTKETEKIRSRRFSSKEALKLVSLMLVALLIASSAIAIYEYNLTMDLQKEITNDGLNYGAISFYNEFGVIPATNVNSSFSPPVSMYRALQIGLEADGLNKTSLNGKVVSIYLMHWGLIAFNDDGQIWLLSHVTSPPVDYSDVNGTSGISRYVWEISVENSAGQNLNPVISGWAYYTPENSTVSTLPAGFITSLSEFTLVDAATGEIVT
jgi:DNA-binding HxlR family transcriptional regulator